MYAVSIENHTNGETRTFYFERYDMAEDAYDMALFAAEGNQLSVQLSNDETGEVLAYYNAEGSYDWRTEVEEDDYDWDPDMDNYEETGFNPYLGCEDWDC